MNRKSCRSYAFHTDKRAMMTLADLFSAVEDPSSPGWRGAFYHEKTELLRTLRYIAEMANQRLDQINIGDILGRGFDEELLKYVLTPEVVRRSAANCLGLKNQLLLFAFACGWPCSDFPVARGGETVKQILYDAGSPNILHYAIRQAWTPKQLTPDELEKWMQEPPHKKNQFGT